MEVTGFVYKALAVVRFTPEEIAVMVRCSKCHYDGKCKDLSVQGGLLYGWTNLLAWRTEKGSHDPLEEVLDFSRLDTLCKVVEFPPPDVEQIGRELHKKIYDVLTSLNAEYTRLNPPT